MSGMDELALVEPATDVFARENALLRQRNAQLEGALSAVRDSDMDAIVIAGVDGDRLFTLNGADRAYRLLVEEMGEGAITVTATGVVVYANRRFAEMLGKPLQQVIGSRVSGCFAPEGRQVISALLKEGRVSRSRAEVDLLTEAGHRVPTLLAARRLVMDGLPDGVCMVVTDLSMQKLGEAAIQTRQAMLEVVHAHAAASRAKSEFLANISHEIRTPMSTVAGLAYLLSQTTLDKEQVALLADVGMASKSLLMLIDNVLDLSKIEAGEMSVERAGFNLRDQLKELSAVLAVQAEAKDITFEIDAPEDLPQALEGDPTRLKQILSNLLSNAIKFTVNGGVKLQVRQVAASTESVTLSFDVRDTGIGVDLELQPKLFEPFAQADASISRRFGSTGLGLSIAKRLAAVLGGSVSLVSTSGVGSHFKVILKFGRTSGETLADLEASPAIADERALLGVRALVVDDSEINLDMTKRILEAAGAQVWVASNGQEAFSFLRTGARQIDIVLMDLQMPVLDGHQAARRIRLELKLSDMPIIALTARALSIERQKASDSGMDGYIVKPFSFGDMVSSILQALERKGGREVAGNNPSPQEASRRTTSQAWPQIAGIDSADVRERLSGDVYLFQSMLQRLIVEFGGDDSPQESMPALGIHAARMHKLKGSAGLLGAKAIQELARQAEVACGAGAADQAAELTSRIAIHLRRLQKNAAITIMPDPLSGDHPQMAEVVTSIRRVSSLPLQKEATASPADACPS